MKICLKKRKRVRGTRVIGAPQADELFAFVSHFSAPFLTEVRVDNDGELCCCADENAAAPEGTNKVVRHLLFHKISISHCLSISERAYVELSTRRPGRATLAPQCVGLCAAFSPDSRCGRN